MDIDTIQPARPFLEWLREVHPELRGTDGQLMQLIGDALYILNPDNEDAIEDSLALGLQFHYIAEQFGGDLEYPDAEHCDGCGARLPAAGDAYNGLCADCADKEEEP